MDAWRAWTLVFHLLGVILWTGGLLAVGCVRAPDGSGAGAADAAERLFAALVRPGVLLVLVTGTFLLLLDPARLRDGWLHAKLVLVLVLIVLDTRIFRAAVHAGAGGAGGGAGRPPIHLQAALGGTLVAILVFALVRPF
jgi:putative membrane protein